MGITTIVLVFSLFSIFYGTILGLIRGRNRSILRFCLVLLSAIIPILFKDSIIKSIMSFEIKGKSLSDTLNELILNSGVNMPEAIQNILFTLIEIILSILVFFIFFLLISFITWLVLFPILKLIIRKGRRRHPLVGAIFGLLQGVIVSFVICAPLTGLVIQTDKIAQIQFQGKNLIALPEEIGVNEYVDSAPAKFYDATGSWLFDMVSSKTNADGNTLSISDACDVVSTVVGIADTFTSLSSDMQAITSTDSTPQEQVDTIKKIGDSLISIGNSVNSLNGDSKAIVQDLVDGVKEMVVGESGGELPAEIEKALNDLDIENLKLESAGAAMNGIAAYIEKTNDEFENSEPVTQEEINSIVNGLADNTFILDVIASETDSPKIFDVDEENKEKFENAVNNANLSEDNKETLRKMFGLSLD